MDSKTVMFQYVAAITRTDFTTVSPFSQFSMVLITHFASSYDSAVFYAALSSFLGCHRVKRMANNEMMTDSERKRINFLKSQ